MRKPDRHRGLLHFSIAGGIALIALGAAVTVSEAAFRGSGGGFGGVSAGPRPAVGTSGAATSRVQKLNAVAAPGTGKGKNRSNGQGTGIAVTAGDGDGGRPPGRRLSRRPGIGPVGPIIGTGVAIGAAGAAVGRASLPAGGGSAGGPPGAHATVHIPPPGEQRYVKDEVVLEFRGAVTRQQTAPILARHRLALLDRAYFPLTDTTVSRLKITDKRSVRTVLSQLRSETAFISAQANFIYQAAEQQGAAFALPQPETPPATPVVASSGARPAAGDPAQYALAKLRLSEAHGIATGNRVLIAVIDSGIDTAHPELQGAVAGSFDALSKPDKPDRPHAHGTAIAGAIAAHARLLGVAPSARILAIRAFGATGRGVGAEATTFAVIRGVQHATAERARVINMSFAGPQDPGLARHLARAKAAGVVLVAASGNLGPKSPPQYPAANPDVIAVTATDAGDRIFHAATIGPHVAVTAPGVDILLPAPNAGYQLSSGTSFAAAHVSGIVALILERKPDLTPDAVRAILIASARDLGPRGRDDAFGAGLVDAYQALLSVATGTVGAGAPPAEAPAEAAALTAQ
jgi:hypothetical protein